MIQTYKVKGMSCTGCKYHVEQALNEVEGILKAEVDLDKGEAYVELKKPVDVSIMDAAVKSEGMRYSILMPGQENEWTEVQEEVQGTGTGRFYCPMQCEGDKIYDQMGDCPVCGMDLVEEMSMESVALDGQKSADELKYEGLKNRLWLSLLFTVPIFIISMSEMIPENPLYQWISMQKWNWVQFILSLPVVFYTCWMFFERAFKSFRGLNLNMFTLIGIGAGVAWIFSVFALFFPGIFPEQFKTEAGTVFVYFEAATVILTLVLLGQVLEARAHGKTNRAIKELLQLSPREAIQVVGGEEIIVPIEQIREGHILRVKPGDKIPVDGVVIEGYTNVDESMITGEPIPTEKGLGDAVKSGTINQDGSILMRAEKVGNETLLSQIIQLVNQASRSRAPIQKLADKISAWFVPIVVLISFITFITWSILGPEPPLVYALVNAIAVLIIACPCALGLATPMSVMVGIGKGAQNGILIKNAEALEQMAKIDTLVIDKTGTLTEGKPVLEKIHLPNPNSDSSIKDEATFLSYAASLSLKSEHPLAKAIVDKAKQEKSRFYPCKDFLAIRGKGSQGLIQGKKIALGNSKMMKMHTSEIPTELEQLANKQREKGKTISYLSIDREVMGFVVISDPIKKSSIQAIKKLKDQNIRILMLTGDNKKTAIAVAAEIGIDEIKAEMLPENKLQEVKSLQEKGHIVAFAGDGINDAPALAQSDVGISMGTGTDVAMESSHITLVKGDLQGIVKARNLSQKVVKNIRQNLFFALVYNSVGVPVAAGVLFPIFGLLLSPMIAALAMSFSSVSVISNALRLRNVNL